MFYLVNARGWSDVVLTVHAFGRGPFGSFQLISRNLTAPQGRSLLVGFMIITLSVAVMDHFDVTLWSARACMILTDAYAQYAQLWGNLRLRNFSFPLNHVRE